MKLCAKLSLFFVLAAAFAMPAGDPAGFYLWKKSDLKTIASNLVPKIKDGAAGQPMADLGHYTFAYNLRRETGQSEIHQTKTDIFVVEAGEATLIIGGTIPDGKETAPNEIRGTSIVGGVEHKLEAGDVVTIAAGTPHHLKIAAGKEFQYLTIKVAKP